MRSDHKKSVAVFFCFIQLILFFFISAGASADNLEFNVVTGKGAAVTGVKVYAFTGAGAYTGINTATNSSGTAIFDTASFQPGNYKFRVDYLGTQFWSDIIPLPETLTASLTIPDETALVTVTTSAGASQSVKVYLFTGAGAYLGINKTTDTNGEVTFDLPIGSAYKFRADILSNQYWSSVTTIQSGTNNIPITAGGGVMQVTVQKSAGTPMSGIQTYLYNATGTYLGITQTSNGSGVVQFTVPEGNYKVRADYLGYQYWSSQTAVTGDTDVSISVAHQDVVISVQGAYQSIQEPIQGIKVYLYTSSGTYMGQNLTTDANGQVTFNLPQNSYKVRADYMSQQFWSDNFTWQDSSVNIPMADAEVTVTGMGLPLESVNVYLYTGTGTYLGITKTTNSSGKTTFRTPSGPHKFRADYQASQYWSNTETLVADQVNPVSISTGGGILSFTVTNGSAPLSGVNCYLFTESGTYLGLNKTTDNSGAVTFPLANGNYKVRVDYLGYQYWSGVYSVPGTLSGNLDIPHQDVVVTVKDSYQGTQNPVQAANVYLFTSSDTYMGQTRATDANGQVTFNLPQNSYKVRADFMSQQFWSGDFTWQDSSVNIPMADAEVTVTGIGQPLENVNVYLFTGTGTYLGINKATDSSGKITFRTPSGPHKFRADYQASQYWSNAETLVADQVTPVAISAGGGTFNFTVTANSTSLAGVNCYLFTASGTYLGLNKTTDSNGAVSFDLSNGNYKIRIDYLGNQFWSANYTVPDTLTGSLDIPHQDVVITVQDTYQGTQTPLQGVSVYLFTSSGAYMGRNLVTDTNGQVTFNLPQNAYKVRADYMGQQFWSEDFTRQNRTISISKGTAHVHVTRLGVDLEGAVVYLFTGSGSYLGLSQTTTSSGIVEFLIPAGTYNFRVNETGDQRWSGEAAINPEQMTAIRVEMNDTLPPTVSFNADPVNIGEGESAILAWTSTNADTVSINQGIGVVNPNGSITVSPTETTGYTITAEGPNGSITATITVTVIVDTIAPTVTAIPAGGSYNTPQNITLTANEPSTIYYTIDSSEPTMVSNLYSDPISISADTTLKAIAVDSAGNQSTTITEEYIITTNSIPSIRIIEPDGVDDIATTSYTITWEDDVPDNNAQISLYYDTDNSSEDGTLIISGLSEDDDGVGDQFVWDMSEIPNGYYYIYAVIDDGVNGAEIAYSACQVKIKHPDYPFNERKITASDGAPGELFGGSVSTDGNYAIIGAQFDGENGNDSGAAYIFKKEGDVWNEKVKLTASDGNAGDRFGCSVSINGDYVIVGAYGAYSTMGEVYIFQREGEIWNEKARLLPWDEHGGILFGWSVSINSDYAIIGAPYDRVNGFRSGSAYIFKHEGDSWNKVEKVFGFDLEEYDNFGSSISIDNNYLIIGAPGKRDNSYMQIGAAYIFKLEGGLWNEKDKLSVTDAGVKDQQLGVSVSINGNYAIVGAIDDVNIYDNRTGSAYIFKREGEKWNEEKKLLPSDGMAYDGFGTTVSISGYYAIVGSENHDEKGSNSGAIYLYRNLGGSWDEIYKITAFDGESNDYFGTSIAINGYNAIITSPHDDDKGDSSGSVYTYELHPGYINLDPVTIPSGGSAILTWHYPDATSVFIDNGIGYTSTEGSVTLSPSETTTYTVTSQGPWGTDIQSVTVYLCEAPTINILEIDKDDFIYDSFVIKWNDDALNLDAKISFYYDTDDSGADGSLIINELSEDGDCIGDQFNWDTYNVPSGYYYVYAVINDGVNAPVVEYFPERILVNHIIHDEVKLNAYEGNGSSVSISGDYAVLGAVGDYGYGGEVIVFKRDGANWVKKAKLVSPCGTNCNSYFGQSVSINGDLIIVSADYEESAYIFKRYGESWEVMEQLGASDGEFGDQFSASVFINGDYAIVGAPYNSAGSVYIFKRDGEIWNEIQKLSPPDGFDVNAFGSSVSASGDYLIIGTGSDLAFIFKREGEEWIFTDELIPSMIVGDKSFGDSVSINGDYAIVGAKSDNNYSGAAFIFKREDENWIEITKLTAFDHDDVNDDYSLNPHHGRSVFMSTNYALVGAPYSFNDGVQSGAAYLYKREGDRFDKVFKIPPSNGLSDAIYGGSVAIDGVYAIISNRDTYDLVSAYIYSIGPGTIHANSEYIPIAGSTTLSWSYFCATSVFIDNGIGSVAAVGSVNISPAETTTYTITAEGPWGTYTRSITVYVCEQPTINIMEPLYNNFDTGMISIKWSDSAQYPNALISLYYDTDNLGADGTLIVDGLDEDPDGIGDEYIWNSRTIPKGNYYIYAVIDDGVNEPVISYSAGTIAIRQIEHKFISPESLNDIYFGNSVAINEPYAIVGAFSYRNESDPRVGAVYIYKQNEETWNRIKKIIASDMCAFDEFGWSVASSGEYLIVGAPARGSKPGSAYIFKIEGDSWNEITKLTGRDDYATDEFGYSVAIDGNYAVIGAPSDNFVYIYKQNGGIWSKVARLTPPEGTGGCFGKSVSISGDYVMASASICATYDSGQVLIFKREGDSWNNISTLTASDQVYEDGFSSSLSISGNYAVVGAPSSYYNPSGSAYVFKRDGETWSEIAKLTATDLADRTLFGKSVDISGDTIVVGSQGPNSIHVYKLKNNTWIETHKFYPSYPEEGEIVNSVAVSDSYALVGAADPSTWSGIGAAYIFALTHGTFLSESNVIVTGDNTTLSWSYPGATSVFIDNGIGYVSPEGSVLISPTETTTYTITSEGPWGTDTRNITVGVFNPTSVTLNASASSIIEGNSIVLTWESTNAEEVIIEPGNITVEASGSLVLFPSETTTYQITALNPASEATANVTVEVIKRITITSPLNGDVINSPYILVEGTLYNPSGQELGVVVNGITASVNDNQFTANHVPLKDGDNEIVVTCTTASGGTATASISVYADTTVDFIKITADDESGVAPFETTLRLDASFAITEEPEITYTGPGVLDILKIENENNYTITTSTPGLYYITAEVVNGGSTYTDTISILVINQEVVVNLFNTIWDDMTDDLLGGDIDSALYYFVEEARDRYEEIFLSLGEERINDLFSTINHIEVDSFYGQAANCGALRDEAGETYSYPVVFIKDENGLWKIMGF